ncbi:phosphoribosylanthranilate isomerase [Nitrosophilus labii]|uniref:phosphoribosylanthranilate isomerase n=1 Tax=Nitrosophilus labii TaxID=2706014 RepID=UPI001657195F|nr:phosphoribosylanthranilate isomerase [Nitrosophilus labii]
MRVKICGITNIEDALFAVKAGADALGFVFYEKSPRYIEPKKAKEIIEKLPPFVERVGLFVNVKSQYVNQICHDCNLSLAQIHFEANKEFYDNLTVKHIKVIRAKTKEDITKYEDEYRLVDAYAREYGGSGKRVRLDWFEGVDTSKIILAGGLNPQNLDSVKDKGFFGVDVSSGVEKSKGKKDHQKVLQFIKKAKSFE